MRVLDKVGGGRRGVSGEAENLRDSRNRGRFGNRGSKDVQKAFNMMEKRATSEGESLQNSENRVGINRKGSRGGRRGVSGNKSSSVISGSSSSFQYNRKEVVGKVEVFKMVEIGMVLVEKVIGVVEKKAGVKRGGSDVRR
ncbi:unnamed protein product [Dovyalis caffra]|uniref:Uncharacterized protein n=1 Tax=Dovyalis caffra TaxID=77055 RepID=A0AAV1QPL3_9ROSI|nr:unnamed protein product [Dovyalis caffra]